MYGAALVHSFTTATIHRHCGAQLGMHAIAQRYDGQTEPPPVFQYIDRPSIDWGDTSAAGEYKQLDLLDREDG